MNNVEHKFKKLLYRTTYFQPEYTPMYEKPGSDILFLFLKDRMEQLMKSKDATLIDRQEYESHLIKNDDLEEAYLELFSLSALFYKCKFEYEGRLMEYFIMYEKRILLVYFKKT